MNLRIYRIVIGTNKVKKPFRIVHGSDFHCNIQFIDKIVPIIKEMNPDRICITGDIIDSSRDDHFPVINRLAPLTDICKTYYVVGNHDISYHDKIWRYDENKQFFENLKKSGMIHLENNKPEFDDEYNICFHGFNIPYIYYTSKNKQSLQKIFEENISIQQKEYYNILLTHVGQLENAKSELALSGHFHNGIIKLLNGTGLIRPGLGGIIPFFLMQKNAHDLVKIGETFHVINGALTKTNSDFLNEQLQSDLVSIFLVPDEAENKLLSRIMQYKNI